MLEIYITILASFLMLCGDIVYIGQIVKGAVTPTKSTWVIFSIVTGLNVSTFLATKFDVVSGAYGIIDFAASLTIFFFIQIYFRKNKLHFKSFEKYYLVGVFICVLFWIISNNSFTTNLLAQLLIMIGYIPTIHNILLSKKSTESKSAWTIWTTGSLLSIYPALVNHNILAIVYSLRGAAMCAIVLFLTYIFSKKT